LLGLDERISAGLSAIVVRVKIAAADVPAERLRALVEWGDSHSPIGCTTRDPAGYSLEVEVG